VLRVVEPVESMSGYRTLMSGEPFLR
jgi:hypothetical protein